MQDYDATLKLLLQSPASSCLAQLFGETRWAGAPSSATGVGIERWLNPELPQVRAPRADLLGETTAGELLHLEIQSGNDSSMAIRMAEYALATYAKYKRFPIQLVLYVGEPAMSMKESVRLPETGPLVLEYQCRFVDIRDLDGEALLASPYLGDHILAVLTRLSQQRANVKRILGRIAQEPPPTRDTAFTHLIILSGLRGIEEIIREEASRMPILANIEDHKIIGPALREGRRQGLTEGRREGAEEVLRALLSKKFGLLNERAERRLADLSISELDDLAVRLLDAASLESLFPEQ